MATNKPESSTRNGSYSEPITVQSEGTEGVLEAGRVDEGFYTMLGVPKRQRTPDSSSTPLPSRFIGQ